MSIRHLDQLLNPRSVVVVGASDREGSVGATVWRNLRSSGFTGAVRAMNPRLSVLDGEPVAARCDDLPETPDLAVLCIPPAAVPDMIDALGRAGTRAAIVMTAGLDRTHKQAMLDAARPHLLRVLGPNCLGLLSPRIGLNASFAHTNALPGDIAFVSQSGALVTAVLDWARSRRIGFSHMVSLGEHADVDFGDLLDHLASDARTRSILLYIESVESPRKFMSAARAAARNKPVIVVKAGRAGRGVAAAASHTGAMAGADPVFDAAIRRAGMLRVDTLDELFMAAETLARFRGNRDDRLTVLTNGGGAGVMAADAAAARGVQLPALGESLKAQLDAALPPTWSHANPIDIIGDAPVRRYTDTLSALLATPDAGAVLFLHAPTAIVRSDDIARACVPLVRRSPGRVMACWLGDAAVADARRIFEDAGVADYATPEQAVHAFSMLSTYRANQRLLLEVPTASESATPDTAKVRALVQSALAQGREMLDESEAKSVLQAYGIPVVPTRAVSADAQAACEAASELGYPVVLKIRSADISHKSDVGGVALNLRDADELSHAAAAMLARIRALRPAARIDGFSVQAMVRRPMAQELIVGASVDPVFGPVILFGQGGTAVEVLADSAVTLPPLNRVLARELVARTRVSRLLAGYRDHPPARMEALHDALIAVSALMADIPELAELDINPLWADHDGVMALDARMRISTSRPAGASNFAIAPYPAHLSQTLAWHGHELCVRPIRPEDGPQHRAFLEQMSPDDLHMRFFSSSRTLAQSETARLTQIDYAREMAFVATQLRPDASEEIVGVVHAVSDPDDIEAEFAIAVRSDLHGQGLGHLLMQRMTAHLRARGTQRMTADVLRINGAMRELMQTLGFTADPHGADAQTLRYSLRLDAAGQLQSTGESATEESP
ncbi:bifunctional acetate--CoA ligase family protein/GNAT family N-acetyltransferase [Piscinibacter terrae]|uniref:GNAT family N-acetyltransferase n=1 Tax=Piscinibacter terrae TaxID=2496871 RepID=A0A3N7HRQ1_9BURK|nr:bifunctional acetate--CoA ligase family protein/GNAT family N-acetyltransferase [Albitalea terrae]RQP24927.1 GNAT family N-acetyltransferase [Albitalea terrae]